MRFAKRMQRSVLSPSMALADRVRKLRDGGADIINFGTRPDAPSHVKQAATAHLNSAASSSYTEVRGLPELRDAIVAKLACENALDANADAEVVVTAGAKQAVFAALMVLVGDGDEVLVEDPGWVSFRPIVELTGATPVAVPLRKQNGFVIDVDEIRQLITARTRVLLLCNPHNPTGSVLDETLLKAVANLACEHDLIVVVDEAYERLVYDGRRHISMASLPNMRERTVTVQTTSKIYNMGGWRVGWIVAPPEIANRIGTVQSNIIGCPTSFAQAGAVAALRDPIGMGDYPIDELLSDFAARRDLLVAGLRRIPGVTCLRASGGFFVFPELTCFGLDSVALSSHLLDDAGLATMPGSAFGALGEGHLRVLFTSPISEIETGLERMTRSLAKLPRVS